MFLKEGVNKGAVFFQECLVCDGDAGHQTAASILCLEAVPHSGQIHHHGKLFILGEGGAYKGLGEKSDGVRIFSQNRGHFGCFGFELQFDVIFAETCSGENIAERIFRSGSLTCEINGLSS